VIILAIVAVVVGIGSAVFMLIAMVDPGRF